jgi:hypothetical protein
MRKRAEGGDQASEYFNCTKHVAGITDTRFQAFMPDALRWLGVTKIHRFISMSDMKYDAIINAGIKVSFCFSFPPLLSFPFSLFHLTTTAENHNGKRQPSLANDKVKVAFAFTIN